ncbi:Arginine-binding extracellular protein ArtP precursor [bacterium YEK0313]|nr:Arginine-binding extracellular protein ArtP precursor [bacterium YEK0313]
MTTDHVDRRQLLTLAGGLAAVIAAPALVTGRAAAQGANEATFDRIMRTKTIRVAGLPGELPFFQKSLATGEWSGACADMAQDIAKQLGGMKVEFLDSTYGNSVLQVQAGQIDIAFALNATPARALAIDFTRPVFNHAFGIVAKPDFSAKTWADINKPEVKIAVDLGSSQEAAARRFAPKASITAYRTRDEVVLALASGRAQCAVFAALVGLTAAKRNPAIGRFIMLTTPVVSLTSNIGVRREQDRRWRDFLDVWIDFNRGTGQIREWLINGLTPAGVTSEDVPAEVTF